MDSDIQMVAVRTEALTWPERARSLTIVDAQTYEGAGSFLLGIKTLRAKIADTFDKHIKAAFSAHKALVKEKADAEAPLTEAETIIKRGLVAYDTAQEQIRLTEQRRLTELARQQEETRRIEEAAALELEAHATGDDLMLETAHAIIAEPVYVPQVQVEKATPKVSGISYRTTYSARVTDELALVRFVAANPQYLGLVSANMVALNGQARSLKMAMQIPGVVVDEKRDIAAGTK